MIRCLLTLPFLTGCYTWHQGEDITQVTVRKVITLDADAVCHALIGQSVPGCSVRNRNTTTGMWNCAIIVMPADVATNVHEPAHCLGYDHD